MIWLASEPCDCTRDFAGNFLTTPPPEDRRTVDFVVLRAAATFFDVVVLPTARLETAAFFAVVRVLAFVLVVRVPTDRVADAFRAPTDRVADVFRAPTARVPDVFRVPTARVADVFRVPTDRVADVFRAPTDRVADVVRFATLARFATVVLAFVATDLPVVFRTPLAAVPLRAVLVFFVTVEARFAEPVVRLALALAAMNLFP